MAKTIILHNCQSENILQPYQHIYYLLGTLLHHYEASQPSYRVRASRVNRQGTKCLTEA